MKYTERRRGGEHSLNGPFYANKKKYPAWADEDDWEVGG
jgi:hypothetical protein